MGMGTAESKVAFVLVFVVTVMLATTWSTMMEKGSEPNELTEITGAGSVGPTASEPTTQTEEASGRGIVRITAAAGGDGEGEEGDSDSSSRSRTTREPVDDLPGEFDEPDLPGDDPWTLVTPPSEEGEPYYINPGAPGVNYDDGGDPIFPEGSPTSEGLSLVGGEWYNKDGAPAFGDEDEAEEHFDSWLEKQEADAGFRAQAAGEYAGSIFNPDAGSQEVADWIRQWTQTDDGEPGSAFGPWIDLQAEGNEWMGYALSGYETAICEGVYGGEFGSSSYFQQDYPGHYQSGTFPSATNTMWAVGQRIKYPGVLPAFQSMCTNYDDDNGPAWYPSVAQTGNQTDTPVTAMGYLYTVSWYVGNPYTEAQIETEMSPAEISAKGLEDDGALPFQVMLITEECDTDSNIPSTAITYEGLTGYVFPSESERYEADPGSYNSMEMSFYDKAWIERICVIFPDGYEYHSSDSGTTETMWPPECEAGDDDEGVIVEPLGALPGGFDYTPEPEVPDDVAPPPTTDVSGGEGIPSECTLPPSLCP